MKNALLRLAFLGLIILWPAGAAEQGHLLVSTYGTLLVMRPDGVQNPIADNVNSAALSPDGRHVAYTTSTNPRTSFQTLMVAPIEGRPAEEIVRLPQGAHFDEIGWLPNGSAIAYEAAIPGKGTELFLAAYPSTGAAPRSLGHSYQGFSFSPDGLQMVHAVNSPVSALEVLDLRTGKRTLIHKTKSVVWDARYSPDGRFIAYLMTIDEPEKKDDEPDCTPPTIGLWVYSATDGTERQITVRSAPKDWRNVKNFDWSPDSARIALTLGVADCDYPGSVAAVFLTTLDMKNQTRLSSSEMAFEPAFSPDGSAVAFVDFSESPAKLLRYHLATGKVDLIRRASEENNYYRLLGWK